MNRLLRAALTTVIVVLASAWAFADDQPPVLMGQGALGDFTKDAPGVRRLITLKDLPEPYATKSADTGSQVIRRPQGATLKGPDGFKVEEFVTGLRNPRLIRTAPNGDIFVAESQPGRIRVLRIKDGESKPDLNEVFATGLGQPFGIAFYPPGDDPKYIYIGDTDEIVRFPYKNGQTKAEGKPEHIADLAGGGRLRGGGHWTRDVIFSPNGKKMYASVGSRSNAFEDPKENNNGRAAVLEFNPDGSGMELFATGIRNPVTIAFEPKTGELWTSVNERDGIGDDLVPDYITHIQRGGFYGWPWYWMGEHQDPRHKGEHPELKDRVITPDVLLQSHSASLQMTFYTGTQFPERYRGNIFAAEHGSWNRAHKTGYKIIMVPLENGKSNGTYEDFVTGFIMPDGKVWGRPVGLTVAHDGSLLISDDGSNTIWRVSYGK